MSATVTFQAHKLAALTSGDYNLTVNLPVTAGGESEAFAVSRAFHVAGPRFSLDPAAVQSVFPPRNSFGDHSNVLPHVMLTKLTLPWERPVTMTPADAPAGTPWLALLLFEDGDPVETGIVAVKDLALDPPVASPDDEEMVTVIDVEAAFLRSVLPTVPDLAFLAHLRESAGMTTSTVICNRLPGNEKRSTVHLVSLERRFRKNADGTFEFIVAEGAEKVRLVSLASWSFVCQENYEFSENALRHLHETLQLTEEQVKQLRAIGEVTGQAKLRAAVHERLGVAADVEDKIVKAAEAETFKGLLFHLDRAPSGPRLPAAASADAERFLSRGCVPLRHRFRSGLNGISWFHGPLVPGGPGTLPQPVLPARVPDELVRYDTAVGMFDVSHAAAWELGRLLGLRDPRFRESLHGWRREKMRAVKVAAQQAGVAHLPMAGASASADVPLPPMVDEFLSRLARLEDLPFSYLVPSENLLPPESIRFFALDPGWIKALLDGAFGISRTSDGAIAVDRAVLGNFERWLPAQDVTGFLLRSDLVPGWPNVRIHALNLTGQTVEPARRVKLSPDILLCLFPLRASGFEFKLDEEALHFGFERSLADPNVLQWRRPGREAVNLTVPEGRRALDVAGFAGSIAGQQAPFTSAHFGASILAAPEMVRFSA